MAHENQNLWFIKPTKIDLKEFVQRPKFESAALDLTYTKHLVAVDGLQPEVAENVRELGLEPSKEDSPTALASKAAEVGD